MGDRRKRKPAWDEDETKHSSGMSEHNSWIGKDRRSSHGSRHYHEVPESRISGARESRDNSEWTAWEPIEEHPIAPMSSSFKNNAQNGKEFGGGKRYSKEMSPGLDDMELRNYNEARDYDQSHSQRYRGRGRSRSRSLSRGRERERRRGYTRSRSRSRSRNDVKANDQTRSRSPISSRLSYGWGDRRGGPEKSSQICRDFSAGSCRRGSQCYFFHPNTTSRRDRDLLEDETTESFRGRTDHNRIPKYSHSRGYSGFESRNDFSDPYHEDRRAATCKDFLRGMCRWGDSCRFSHRAVSDDGFDKGNNGGKPMCKFFAAGNCSRENCRFSHDNPSNERRISESRSHDKSKLWGGGPTWDDETKTSDFNDRRGDVTERHSRDRIKSWGPTWDDVAKTSDINERRGTVSESRSHDRSILWEGGQICDESTKIPDINDRQGDVADNRSRDNSNLGNDGPAWDDAPKTSDTRMPFYDSDNEQIDDRGGRSWENENKKWGIAESGNYGRKMGFAEPIAKDKTPNKQDNLVSNGSQLQDHDGIVNVDGQNAFQENPSLSVNALQQNIYPASQIQQQHSREIDNNQMNSFASGIFDEVKETNSYPIPFSGNQNVGNIYPGHSSISSESDKGRNMLLHNPPSNGFCTDLNEPNTEIVNPSNDQTHTQNDQIVSQSSGFLEAHVPQLLASLLNKNQVTYSRSFVNEHAQTHPEIPSFPTNSEWAPRVNLSSVQPNSEQNMGTEQNSSLDLNFMGTEQNNQIPPKKPSPLPSDVVPSGFDSSKTRQEGIVENLEVAHGNKAVGDGIKDLEENKLPETQNGHEKVDEGASKDEKGMRLFKNNLVEFVKEILKPTWKEGRMSRDDHKTVVKKVVEKVSSTIHSDHIPKTQEKIDQYLASSKPKISKLVQAYVERFKKKDS
ncbi:hypothetical protein CASFOL_016802 [Castilleja foliolosa]|uniref:C3H1-type domain-containing protein n=1 Tax=Castilleja foliolosa TaxID=1961234 RepID=A0ABD3D996_9LAMI